MFQLNQKQKSEPARALRSSLTRQRGRASQPYLGLPSTSNEIGHFNMRFDSPGPTDEHELILSWKDGFRGGPEVIVQDAEGGKRLANDGDYQPKPVTGSDTGESDDASSVIFVHDLGFSAAPTQYLDQFQNFTVCGRGDVDLANKIPGVDNLRAHLQLDPKSGVTVEKSIRWKIEDSLAWSRFDELEYLPLSAFQSIFDIKTITALVKEKLPDASCVQLYDKMMQIIGNGASNIRLRILGILLFMKCFDYIDLFVRDEIYDDDLPLKHTPSRMDEFFTRRSSSANKTLFKGWDRGEIEHFYLYQKWFCVPFFDFQEHKLHSYVLDDQVRLPWQLYAHKTSGGNGIIHRLQIHPSHHNYQGSQMPGRDLNFAVKEIHAGDVVTYQQELHALEISSARMKKEKHLIKLLLTFQHGDKYYLIFEWADGNLAEFWQQTNSKLEHLTTTWAANQCLGISKAVQRIHGLATWQKMRRKATSDSASDNEPEWGRHGDIKPNNILWFSMYGEERDLLVVSDLGLTRYHSRLSRSLVHHSHIDGYTSLYRAPELNLGDHHISQKYDIWSLGCVYLEFCIWYLEGIEAVWLFEEERESQDESDYSNLKEDKYFNIKTSKNGQKYAAVKPVVEEWIKRLLAHNGCNDFMKGMLNLISKHMLVVEQKKRFKIDRICSEIFKLMPEKGFHDRGLEVDDLEFQHVEGNIDSVAADSIEAKGHTRALSIRTTNGDTGDEASDEQSPACATPMRQCKETQPQQHSQLDMTPSTNLSGRRPATPSEQEAGSCELSKVSTPDEINYIQGEQSDDDIGHSSHQPIRAYYADAIALESPLRMESRAIGSTVQVPMSSQTSSKPEEPLEQPPLLQPSGEKRLFRTMLCLKRAWVAFKITYKTTQSQS
ncbi:hypothetical protein BP6252_13387 [Coleophoma cylindrospora]|uniref:Protein kinase domain-containing protein n=1 Tax=Coleophoma cylindrospora TaxID=1849047 RepID=A0A3D8QAV8_9HELO|nr:hypothetical protein BP6252_13387 [Coleophoma cylindrospora]